MHRVARCATLYLESCNMPSVLARCAAAIRLLLNNTSPFSCNTRDNVKSAVSKCGRLLKLVYISFLLNSISYRVLGMGLVSQGERLEPR